MTENELRERLAMHGEALYRRGLAPGSSGNMSVRLQDGLLVTPNLTTATRCWRIFPEKCGCTS